MSEVVISNPRKWFPTVVADHDGARYIFGLPVKFKVGGQIKRYVLLSTKHSSYHHIYTLGMPFLLLIDKVEESSGTGYHSVLYNTSKRSLYESNNGIEFHGHYRIKQLLKFPPRYRPPIETFDNMPRDTSAIAWTVAEGIDELWLLSYVPFEEVEIRLPEEGELELQQLQGHLQYASVELRGENISQDYLDHIPDMYVAGDPWELLPMFKRGRPQFFNHQFKQPVWWLPLPYIYSQPSWLVVVTKDDVELESSDHPPVKLQPGAYILTHPKPQPQPRGGVRVD